MVNNFRSPKEVERIGGVEYLEQGDIGRTMRGECVVTKGGNRAKARPRRSSHYRSRHCRRPCHHHHPHNQLVRAHCAPCNTFGEQQEIYEWIGLFLNPPENKKAKFAFCTKRNVQSTRKQRFLTVRFRGALLTKSVTLAV